MGTWNYSPPFNPVKAIKKSMKAAANLSTAIRLLRLTLTALALALARAIPPHVQDSRYAKTRVNPIAQEGADHCRTVQLLSLP